MTIVFTVIPYRCFLHVADDTSAVKNFVIYTEPGITDENTQQMEYPVVYFLLASSSSRHGPPW
jgi:hypothetical protein